MLLGTYTTHTQHNLSIDVVRRSGGGDPPAAKVERKRQADSFDGPNPFDGRKENFGFLG